MIENMRNGEMLAVLGDQRGDAERGIFVDFFGTPAPANEIFARSGNRQRSPNSSAMHLPAG